MIAHVDMDAFYASVEVLDHPELRGRPVIVGMGARGVVSAASYEARRFGVRSAMPIFQAQRLCPEGVFVPVRMARYQEVSREVMRVLERFSPLVEPISVDEAFLDLAGTSRLWGGPAEVGRAIKETMRAATGLTCSVGVAPVRFLAKIASDRDKPDGLVVVEDLENFLGTVLLKEVSGVGPRSQARLGELGLKRLVEVRALGPERLEKLMGSFGTRLWDLAHGRDPSGVHPGREIKSVSHERTLEADLSDRDQLKSHLLKLSQMVARRLRGYGLMGWTVFLKLKHSDHRLITRSQTLAGPTDSTGPIYHTAAELLDSYAPAGPFRLIGVGVSGLHPRDSGQMDLFSGGGEGRSGALEAAEDRLVARFGHGALTRGGALPSLDRAAGKGHNETTDETNGNGRPERKGRE